ncbi:MAG: hypothetical protein D3916_11715 [Candidatus Electrothrix sp. MAN1_4]|nr:hypothetical protein [Candidatus Electrothrix sp. MAN1_4]
MNINELLESLREIELYLWSPDFRTWLRKQSDDDRGKLIKLRGKVRSYRIGIETEILKEIADALAELGPPLESAIKDLQDEIDKKEKLVRVIDTLGRVLSLVSRVVGLAAGPGIPDIVAAVAGVETRSALMSDKKVLRGVDGPFEHLMGAFPQKRDVVDSPPEDVPVEQVPTEEVLHGIELTDQKLIITVATGGCTEEDSFHIEVNKGYTGLPPYLVTVYRIKSDDCRGNFEPIRISFSRKELGLEGNVDFRILNRIGNTSDHRLKP